MPGFSALVQRLCAPIDGRRHGLAMTVAWHFCALALVVIAPSQLWRGIPAWTLAPAELVQPLLAGSAYL